MTEGLIFISIGLSDEKDISLRALEESRNCDILYAEMFTTKLSTTKRRLSTLIEKPVEIISRNRLEEESDDLLNEARQCRVGILVGGDCLTATTHISLLIEAIKRGVPVKVVHGSSILTAIAETGLSIYKFGRVVSLPLPEKGSPDTVLDVIEKNLNHGLHTLILLDLDTEADLQLTINQAMKILIDANRPETFDEETLAVGVARLGSETALIKAGRAREIADFDFGASPHAFIVPGRLHFIETEALKLICDCPDSIIDDWNPSGELDYLIGKYVKSCQNVLRELKLNALNQDNFMERVKNLIEYAARYLDDAMFYASERKATSLAAVCYCEGILDALRLLGLAEFEW